MKTKIFLTALAGLLLASCGDDDSFRKPYGPNDGVAPGKVEVVSYTAIPGGAIIDIKGPADEDLLYIRATYTLASGQEMEVKASAYESQITVEGFNDCEEKTVTFQAVDRMENAGETTTFSFIPAPSALSEASETLGVRAAFGGINVTFDNPKRGNLILEILTKNEYDDWTNIHTEYTSAASIRVPLRGLDPDPIDFALTLRDRWDNTCDTLFATVTPLAEFELEKRLWKEMHLDTDEPFGFVGMNLSNAWDGITGGFLVGAACTNPFATFPVWFTFDLGVSARLSRLIWWGYGPDLAYSYGDLQKFEIYGRNDLPTDGSWDGWTLIAQCECKRPSGLPAGVEANDEDLAYHSAGEHFEIMEDAPEVRYIRIKAISSWDGYPSVWFHEISFFGQKINN